MRYVVIGGGIVGLATAHQLTLEHPHATVTVLEKEDHGRPQTGPQLGRHPRGRLLQARQPQGRRCAGRARLHGGVLSGARHPAPISPAS